MEKFRAVKVEAMTLGDAAPGPLVAGSGESGLPRARPTESDWIEALPLPAALVDAASRKLIRANDELARRLGVAAESLAGRPFDEVFQLDPAGEPRKQTGESGEVFARLLRRAGDPPLRVSVTLTPLRREGSAFLFAIAQDHGRQAPRPSESVGFDESHFRDLFESANELVCTHDPKGRILMCNAAWLRALGLALRDALQTSILDLVDRDFLPLFQAKLDQRRGDAAFTPPYEILFRARDGRALWLEISTRTVSKGGEPFCFQSIGRDITHRKRYEETQRESQLRALEQQKLLEMMIEQSPYAIAFWNPDGSFFHCNDAFAKLFGSVPPHAYNILADPQFHSAGLAPYFERAFDGESVHIDNSSYDASLFPGNEGPARPLWLRITLFPLIDSRGHIIRIVSFFRDITAQVDAERAKDRLESQLFDAQKLEAIGTLAGGVAHDFNNLLTGIGGYLDLLRSMTGDDIHPFLDKAETVVQRGTDLTRQLLAYARKSRIETRVHDMNSTVMEVAALIRQTVDRRIEVYTHITPAPATVDADPGQMSQVLLNLCVNARDALADKLKALEGRPHPEWQPSIKLRVRKSQLDAAFCRAHPDAREGSFVRVSVADTGIGMDEATKRRIFEPFFTTKSVGKGTGLGLATLFGIVKQHQGWVEVDSKPGEGTTFNVYLPGVDATPVSLSDAAMSLKVRGGTETILLADDEEMIRDLVGGFLRSKGYTVLLAIDGQDCLDNFAKQKDKIDLVILDLTMPRLSGKEVLPRLLALRPSLKVVAISGYSFNDSWMDIQDLGAFAFVQKPFNSIELGQTVRRTLDERAHA